MKCGWQKANVRSVGGAAVLGKDVGEGSSRQPLGLWTPASQTGKLPLGRGACLESLGRGCGQASLFLQHAGHVLPQDLGTGCARCPAQPPPRPRPFTPSSRGFSQRGLREHPSPGHLPVPGRHSPLCPHHRSLSLELSCVVLCSLVSDPSST